MARTTRKKPTSVPPRSRRSQKHVSGNDRKKPAAESADFTIVGVGASAGGLEAFGALLRQVPNDADVAIVFVQHLAPQHPSALVELLSAHTPMRVVQVTEGVRCRTRITST